MSADKITQLQNEITRAKAEGPTGPQVSLLGAPTDIGASIRGASMGPEALRVGGLIEELTLLGCDVEDRGNVSGPVNPIAEPANGYRHLEETRDWCAAVRDGLYGILQDGRLPILLGGDHCLAMGSLAAVSDHCHDHGKELSVIWLDAHADFNTPDTTPSGNLHGMPVAVAFGLGHPSLTALAQQSPMIKAENFTQIGIRSVDVIEKRLVNASGIKVYDMRRVDEIGMRQVMAETLERVARTGGHLHVSFDVDFLDPAIAPGVATTVPGGPNYREAQLCMEMIHDSGLMNSLDIMELNPAYDSQNQTGKLAVSLVKSLFGEQILIS
ncbi:arginase [Rhodovibrionaceae bacterium A322]